MNEELCTSFPTSVCEVLYNVLYFDVLSFL